MAVAVGVDVAKELHWVALVHVETGKLLASRKVENDPAAIQTLIDDIRSAEVEHGPATVAIDLIGGIAGLLQVMLGDAGVRLVHVPGLAVNRARRATRGGEHKSDPRDAKVIADQIRLRAEELRPVEPAAEADTELRLLVSRRRELVVDQTRRIARLRDLLAGIHPGLERIIDATNKADLALLARYVTPTQIRRAGRRRITEYLRHVGGLHGAAAGGVAAALAVLLPGTALHRRVVDVAEARRAWVDGAGSALSVVARQRTAVGGAGAAAATGASTSARE